MIKKTILSRPLTTSASFASAPGLEVLGNGPTPVRIYANADLQKEAILKDNKALAGIYRWRNLLSGKTYIGSSVDIRGRMYEYFNANYLSSHKDMAICSALLKYGYSGFSLEILEYCKPENTLERENYYFAILCPEYNISKDATAPMLGRNHTVLTREKISKVRQGVARSEETKAKIGETKKGGLHSEETKRKISETKKAMQKLTTEETKKLISKALGEHHVVLDSETGESNGYETGKKVAEALGCSPATVTYCIKTGKLFKGRYLIEKLRKGGGV